MMAIKLLICAAIGYLLGNIQTGLIIGRAERNIDLRNHGSGSSGATNALRILGRQSAALTLLGDFAKGMLAVCLGYLIGDWYGGMVGALFVVIGHIWPVFFKFHGGKGVATSLGALMVLLPIHTLIILVIGIAVIALSKMVSLASITAAVAFVIMAAVTSFARQDFYLLAFSVLMAALIIFAHRANIGRILHGTESKVSMSMLRKRKK